MHIPPPARYTSSASSSPFLFVVGPAYHRCLTLPLVFADRSILDVIAQSCQATFERFCSRSGLGTPDGGRRPSPRTPPLTTHRTLIHRKPHPPPVPPRHHRHPPSGSALYIQPHPTSIQFHHIRIPVPVGLDRA
ncbi:hypothetical protein EXIGLDRAFT_445604 [Exidia glandulosa HHB12029]|uniref:Uncharacterized protein n=1 Tax=Exidia glandulosa HHB12029 TaxID=1314781 RepID=A0A165Z6N6_EXIGL|nr:hypothetical protein EXIGLDRAFT_445604 [Exidia glandulosa HHB12029]